MCAPQKHNTKRRKTMYDTVMAGPNGPELFQGLPAEVYAWLTDKANADQVTDTTRVRYGNTLQPVYASEYIANYVE
jgi:hypothetical protein